MKRVTVRLPESLCKFIDNDMGRLGFDRSESVRLAIGLFKLMIDKGLLRVTDIKKKKGEEDKMTIVLEVE